MAQSVNVTQTCYCL